jgi:hypothetical protein
MARRLDLGGSSGSPSVSRRHPPPPPKPRLGSINAQGWILALSLAPNNETTAPIQEKSQSFLSKLVAPRTALAGEPATTRNSARPVQRPTARRHAGTRCRGGGASSARRSLGRRRDGCRAVPRNRSQSFSQFPIVTFATKPFLDRKQGPPRRCPATP